MLNNSSPINDVATASERHRQAQTVHRSSQAHHADAALAGILAVIEGHTV